MMTKTEAMRELAAGGSAQARKIRLAGDRLAHSSRPKVRRDAHYQRIY